MRKLYDNYHHPLISTSQHKNYHKLSNQDYDKKHLNFLYSQLKSTFHCLAK